METNRTNTDTTAAHHMAAIAQTATTLILAGHMTIDTIDWDLVREVHNARMQKLFAENADYVLEQVWERANAATKEIV